MDTFFTLYERKEKGLCMLCAKGGVAEADKFINMAFSVGPRENRWFICGACVEKLNIHSPGELMKHFDPAWGDKFTLACNWYSQGLK